MALGKKRARAPSQQAGEGATPPGLVVTDDKCPELFPLQIALQREVTVVRVLTKRRPRPCLHLRVLPNLPCSACDPPDPACPRKGEEKLELLCSGCRGEEGKGRCQKGLLLLLLLASRRRRGEPSGGRDEPGGEQSCWQPGWGGAEGKKKKPCCCLLLLLLRAQGRGQRRLGCLRPRRKLARSRSRVGSCRERGSERGARHANNSGWNF